MNLKIFADTIEQSAKDQIDRLLEIPVFSDCIACRKRREGR